MDKAKVIKEYRELNGLTQKEVADKLKITHSAYSKYERKDRGINDELWYKLCAILGIPRDYNFRKSRDYELVYLENYNIELEYLSERIRNSYNPENEDEREKAKQVFENYVKRIEDDKKAIIETLKCKSLKEYVIDFKLERFFE